MRSLGQGSSGRLDASGCDSRIPRDQGRRAHSCMAARGAGPKRFAGRSRPPQPVPACPSARLRPARSTRWRRRREAPPPRPAFVPSGPRASHWVSHWVPHAEPQARGECPVSSLGAATLAPATAFFFFYLTPHRRTSGAAPVAGPGSQAATTGLRRAPALLGREGRAPATPSARAASPRRTPDEAANPNPRLKCFSNPQTASALRARPLQGPGLWEAGASFSAAPTSGPARCLQSWCSRGPTRVAGRVPRGSGVGSVGSGLCLGRRALRGREVGSRPGPPLLRCVETPEACPKQGIRRESGEDQVCVQRPTARRHRSETLRLRRPSLSHQ